MAATTCGRRLRPRPVLEQQQHLDDVDVGVDRRGEITMIDRAPSGLTSSMSWA
jgi:hypothetical protein